MFSFPTRTILFLLLFAACTSQKKLTGPDSRTIDNLKQHVQYLADDKLEGRRTGTNGEELAMQYISDQFRSIGLSPKGTEYYTQKFVVNDGKEMDDATSFSLNGKDLETGKDYFIYPFSPDKFIDSSPLIALQEANIPWFFDLGEKMEENKDNPHFDLLAQILEIVKGMSQRGASAVVFYNTSEIDDKQIFDPKDKTAITAVPVV